MQTKPIALVFGAGSGALSLLPMMQAQYDLRAILDNDPQKWGSEIQGIPVCAPQTLLEIEHDKILIASGHGVSEIVAQLLALGVPYAHIDADLVYAAQKPRVLFLEKLAALMIEEGTQGAVAEAGVFRGEFAREINRVFPAKTLYLFDTFAGFDARDVSIDRAHAYSQREGAQFRETSEEVVLSRMPHPEKCVLRRGYFPDTTQGLEAQYCFVSLDMDLYQPTRAGLEYFLPRMEKNGVILLHDYFSDEYIGVKQAVQDYEKEHGQLRLFPIGDLWSIGIQ
ncbi:MAG: hypothetical protein LBN05_05465 [Oscillospiraceae bacterium]|jgi:O-methyltransferase|nr:hypothetical protein [Oscillospiraceae bacterium]